MRTGGGITARNTGRHPEEGGADPTVEFSRQSTDPAGPGGARTRLDMPRRKPAAPQQLPVREELLGAATGGDPPPTQPRRRRRSRWRVVRRVFYALVALIIAVPLFVAFQVWYVAREDSHRKSDAIVVLGAAEYNGTPSAILESRLAHALTLYQIGVAKNIVTVGGNRPGDTHTEGGAGAAWLYQHGVPDDRLVAVRTGDDTLASMKAVGAVFKTRGWHTAVIVTDPEHELRSRTMADDNGMNAVTSPTRSGVMVESRDTQYHYIVRETGGLLYYYAWGRWGL